MAWWVWAAWAVGAVVPASAAAVAWVRALRARRRDDGPENHRRADNGLAPLTDPRQKWYRRLLVTPWTWLVVALTVFFAFGLWVQYYVVYSGLVAQILSDLKQNNLPPQTLSQAAFNEGLLHSLFYATLTLAAYLVIFLLADRWRPTTPTMKYVALGWGACAATFFAIFVNSWMQALLAKNAPGMADNAAAVFVAPFVEEACKASVLFILVMAMRRRVVSVMQIVGLAGLSAAGFAWIENAIYYVRTFGEASLVPGVDAEAYLRQMVMLRGVMTSFGHPLFTMMTAFGLMAGLRQRSKVVRVIAPLTGYLVAALLHMCFNGMASFLDDYKVLVGMGLVVVAGVIFWLIGQFAAQKRVIAWRLDDYIRMGWLRDRDAAVYAAVMSRLKLTVAGWLRGWRIGKATVRLMADVTELAYLRQGIVTGTVDAGAVGREHELVVDARALRGIALDEPQGLRLVPRYRGPVAWRTFKSWRGRRAEARAAVQPVWLPAPVPSQQPWAPARV